MSFVYTSVIFGVLRLLFGLPSVAPQKSGVHVFLVSNKDPADGYLRTFRSAVTHGMLPKIISLDQGQYNMNIILEHIEKEKIPDSDFILLTSSPNLLIARSSDIFVFQTTKAALTLGANVVMATGEAVDFEDEELLSIDSVIADIKADLHEINENSSDANAIHSNHAWDDTVSLKNKLARLTVERQKLVRTKSVLNAKSMCAFAGVAAAMKRLLGRFLEFSYVGKDSNGASFDDLCELAFKDMEFRRQMKISSDYQQHVFKNYESIAGEGSLECTATSENNLIESDKCFSALPPVIMDLHQNTDYIIANLITSGTAFAPFQRGSNSECRSCLDEPYPKLFDKKNFPNIGILAVAENQTNITEFLNSLVILDYPTEHIDLVILCTISNKEEGEDMIKERVEKENQKLLNAYSHFELVIVSEARNVSNTYDVVWKRASAIKNVDYVLIVSSLVRFKEKDVLQNLIRSNRRLVCPLLEMEGTQSFNVVVDRRKGNLMNDTYEPTEKVVGDTFLALIQAPACFGASLLAKSVLLNQKNLTVSCQAEDADNKINDLIRVDSTCSKYYDDIGGNSSISLLSDFIHMVEILGKTGIIPYVESIKSYGILKRPSGFHHLTGNHSEPVSA